MSSQFLFSFYFQVFPSQPKKFQIKSKANGSVTLQWENPNLNDLEEEMLEYILTCNRVNFTEGIL